LNERASAQTCTAPCYGATAQELAACGTPPNLAYLPGDVRRYGADPTASAAANKTAIDCAIAAGYSIYFPDGVFLTTGNHSPKSNTTWWGTGTLKSSAVSNALVTASGITAFTFAIHTDCSLQTATSKTAISIDNSSDFSIQDGRHTQGCIAIATTTGCHDFLICGNTLISTALNNNTSAGAIGVNAQSHDFEISGNEITAPTGAGIAIYNGSYQAIVARNVCVSAIGSGIYINSAQYITVQGNVCRSNGQSGIGLNASAPNTFGYPSYCTVVGNICANNTYDGIDYNLAVGGAQHATWTTISGNVLTGNGSSSTGGTGIYLGNADEVTISGNTIVGNNQQGVFLNSCNYCTVTGNTVVANGTNAANTLDGIYIIGTFNTISGNTSTNNGGSANQRYGISEAGSTTNYNNIVGNSTNNNASGAVNIVGGNTIAQGNSPLSFDKMFYSYVFSSYTTPSTSGIPNGSIWMNPGAGTLNVLQSGSWVAK